MIDQGTGEPRSPRRASRLVVAPHVGDETLGCGGLLARHHDDAAVVILAEPDERRKEQLVAAQHALGRQPATVLGFSRRHLGEDMDLLVGMLADLLRIVQPSMLYLPFPSNHHDRAVAYEAGMRAVRAPHGHGARPALTVLVYDVGAVEVPEYAEDVRWGVHEQLDEHDLERKIAAAVAYGSPLAGGLRKNAHVVGEVHHVAWAEQFAVVRRSPGARVARAAETVGSTS
ncbi:PIG-L deacetylase family protein [Aeromicrobium wangtongii]|uniref:PIG-L deacetylase family protein n=1 Tax=Aeromicrobium wangtongii TaxID=2969247 RepID=UPI0020172AD5|nr:PIG-L family deacetylase [Aeromicrobium wangtongii]MCL3817841.1 hypothetical protein [Aeromicrobium wangtongii]